MVGLFVIMATIIIFTLSEVSVKTYKYVIKRFSSISDEDSAVLKAGELELEERASRGDSVFPDGVEMKVINVEHRITGITLILADPAGHVPGPSW